MSPTELPITHAQIAALPPELRTILRAVIDYFEGRIAQLESELATSQAELAAAKKTPRNSSSASELRASARQARRRGSDQSGKKPGGQPGHPKHERSLIPAADCHEVVILKPEQCRRCGEPLGGQRPTGAAASSLGDSPDQAGRHRISIAPAALPPVSCHHLWPAAGRCAAGASRAAAGRSDGLADGLLQAEQATRGVVPGTSAESTLLAGLGRQAAESGDGCPRAGL